MAAAPPGFSAMLADGLSAYVAFYDWIASRKVSSEIRESDQETVETLPEPDRALPLRVLASLGYHARTLSLEFHYRLPGSDAALRDWYAAHQKRLGELVPEGITRVGLWEGWQPPPRPPTGAVPLEW